MKRTYPLLVVALGMAMFALPGAALAQSQVPLRTPSSAPLWLGIVVLGGIMLLFAVLGWWLYLSPINEPAPVIDTRPQTVRTRRIIGGLACVAGLSLAVALSWDELWHRIYGGFGNDFLWPPHLLMYGSFLLAVAFAGFGLSVALRRHKGSIRRRIRSEPAMSLLGLVSLYEVASLPSDQIWHMIYGLDINAWSLPHLFIFGTAALMFLTACALLMTGRRDIQWESIRHLKDLPVVLLVSLATWIALVIGVVEYEWRFNPAVAHASAAAQTFAGRPGWAYPVVVLTIGILMSHFALHILRKPGVATFSAVLVLVGRVLYLAVGRAALPPGPELLSHAALVIPAIAVDLWYAWRLKDADSRTILLGGITVYWLVFSVFVLPFISDRQTGPEISPSDLVVSVLIGAVVALSVGTGASALADWIRRMDSQSALPRVMPGQREHAVLPSLGGVVGHRG
jgi:hypothetical protein